MLQRIPKKYKENLIEFKIKDNSYSYEVFNIGLIYVNSMEGDIKNGITCPLYANIKLSAEVVNPI